MYIHEMVIKLTTSDNSLAISLVIIKQGIK